jgi:hypothetical protein
MRWDIPHTAQLPLVYSFQLLLDDTLEIDVYDGTGEYHLASATYRRTAEGLAVEKLGPARQRWVAPGRIEQTDDVSYAATWFRVLMCSSIRRPLSR